MAEVLPLLAVACSRARVVYVSLRGELLHLFTDRKSFPGGVETTVDEVVVCDDGSPGEDRPDTPRRRGRRGRLGGG